MKSEDFLESTLDKLIKDEPDGQVLKALLKKTSRLYISYYLPKEKSPPLMEMIVAKRHNDILKANSMKIPNLKINVPSIFDVIAVAEELRNVVGEFHPLTALASGTKIALNLKVELGHDEALVCSVLSDLNYNQRSPSGADENEIFSNVQRVSAETDLKLPTHSDVSAAITRLLEVKAIRERSGKYRLAETFHMSGPEAKE